MSLFDNLKVTHITHQWDKCFTFEIMSQKNCIDVSE